MIGNQREQKDDDEKFCREWAGYFLGWASCASYDILSASNRCFAVIDDDKKAIQYKQLIRNNIIHSDELDADLKNAALIFFDFVDKLRSGKTKTSSKDYCLALLNAMSDEKLTLEYANNLYKSCHKANYYTDYPERERYTISKWIAPDLKSRLWQDTVEMIRDFVLDKLNNQLDKLASIAAKIDLLEKAKLMTIFNEHTSNFRITGAFGRTRPLQVIDAMIDKLNQIPEIRIAPTLGI